MDALKDFEIRCLSNDFDENHFTFEREPGFEETVKDSLTFVCNCLIKNDYEAILQKSLTFYTFPSLTIDFKSSVDSICDLLTYESKNDNPADQIRDFILLFIGISALQEFVRCNFCGPRLNVANSYLLVSELIPDSNFNVSRRLSLDGELIYSNVIHPELLYLSQCLLSNIKNSASVTHKWWLLRCTFLHQYILPERNELLHNKLVSLIDDVYKMDWISDDNHASKMLLFVVESCHVYLYYGLIVEARKCIVNAQQITGLQIELSGAMGKRTQYQQKPVAQLFVKLKRNHMNFTGTLPNKVNEYLPVDVNIQDDTILNKVQFIDACENTFQHLYAEEQIVLLGYCCLVKKSGSFDELLQEELLSYINSLLCQPQVWSVYIKALVMRCKAEKSSSRRVERAIMQMETIVEAIKKMSPPFSDRQRFFYSVSFPAFWVLEKELADLLLSIGCTKSALEIYEQLNLWEDIVECYVRLGRTSCAENVVNEQLAKGESPMLWCLLGDITDNPDHFIKAWELSNHRSARAQRSLGYYFYKKKSFEESIPPFLKSLEINNLQPQVWFSVGHAATQVEDFELAARAYRQVVMFDEDQFEAWNNLANAYLKTKQKERAWRSLNEALKCNYDEWRVWENFLLVSTDIGAFEDALRSWHRLFDIKGKHNDTLLMEILVNAVIKNIPDINGAPSSRLKKKTLELLGRVTSVIVNEPKFWELYANLAHSCLEESSQKENLEKVIQYQQKAIRYYNQRGQWEKDFKSCKEVLMCTLAFCDIYVSYIKLLEGVFKDQQKATAKVCLQNMLARGKKNVEDFAESEKNELNDLLTSLKNNIDEILIM